MYKLYGNIAGIKLIIISFDEKEIIETIYEYIKRNAKIDFRIIIYDEILDMEIPYRSIQSLQEFKEYLEEYKMKSERRKIL